MKSQLAIAELFLRDGRPKFELVAGDEKTKSIHHMRNA